MKVAFDLDDTLDHPAIRDMLLSLMGDPDHSVHVLSAGKTSAERKRRQLRWLGVPDSVALHVVAGTNPTEWGEAKALWLKENGFHILIEDRPDFCKAARALYSSLVVLRVSGPRVVRSHGAIGKP